MFSIVVVKSVSSCGVYCVPCSLWLSHKLHGTQYTIIIKYTLLDTVTSFASNICIFFMHQFQVIVGDDVGQQTGLVPLKCLEIKVKNMWFHATMSSECSCGLVLLLMCNVLFACMLFLNLCMLTGKCQPVNKSTSCNCTFVCIVSWTRIYGVCIMV
jgi:hypothetical protein